jgi:hypothetical protein
MRSPGVRRGLVAVFAVMVCSAASAAAAQAANLRVTVAPFVVHQNATYTIAIAGRYDKRRVQSTPTLLAFIQYRGSSCRATATAEYALPASEWSWVYWPHPQRSQSRPTFKLVSYERARTRFGERRVCAYLYPRSIAPDSTSRPLAIASAGFRNVGR